MIKTLKKLLTIIRKDILIELRTKEMINTMLIFSLTVILISNFAFGKLRTELIHDLAPGVLWIAFVFTGMLGMARSFIAEKDKGCLQGMMLAPSDWSIIYLGKTISNLIFLLIIEIITIFAFIILFDFLELLNNPMNLFLIILIGTFGFVSIGTLLSAISVNSKTREMLLPVLFFPIIIPVLIGSVEATKTLLTNNQGFWSWIRILSAYDIIFFTVSTLFFNYVIEG